MKPYSLIFNLLWNFNCNWLNQFRNSFAIYLMAYILIFTINSIFFFLVGYYWISLLTFSIEFKFELLKIRNLAHESRQEIRINYLNFHMRKSVSTIWISPCDSLGKIFTGNICLSAFSLSIFYMLINSIIFSYIENIIIHKNILIFIHFLLIILFFNGDIILHSYFHLKFVNSLTIN